jgi:hypothetical protein
MENIYDEKSDKRIGVKLSDLEARLLVRLTQNTPVGQYLQIGFSEEERAIMLGWVDDYTR